MYYTYVSVRVASVHCIFRARVIIYIKSLTLRYFSESASTSSNTCRIPLCRVDNFLLFFPDTIRILDKSYLFYYYYLFIILNFARLCENVLN